MGKEKDPEIMNVQFEARKEADRYDKLISNLKQLILYVSVVILLIGVADKYIVKNENQSVTTQIENLDEISEGLKNLQVFIKNQKENLKVEGEALADLKKRKEDLEPLVNLEEEAVNAILKEHQRSQDKRVWLERLFDFLIGVGASAIVAFIFAKRQKRKFIIKVDGGSLD